MYHDVVELDKTETSGFPGPVAREYKVEPERFREQLDLLERTAVPVGLLGLSHDQPACALTFDDGGESGMWIAGELETRGLRGHFFLTTSLIDAPGFLTTDQARQLTLRGHVIGSHSHTHPTCMAECSPRELEREWIVSGDLLGDVLGTRPTIASVPGECVSRPVYAAAQAAGFRILLTSRPTSRARRVGGVLILGRYVIMAHASSATAARYAAGDRRLHARQAARWAAKRTGQTTLGFATYRKLAAAIRTNSKCS